MTSTIISLFPFTAAHKNKDGLHSRLTFNLIFLNVRCGEIHIVIERIAVVNFSSVFSSLDVLQLRSVNINSVGIL